VTNNDKTLGRRETNGHEPRLAERVIGIGDGGSQRIAENRERFLEGDAVLLEVICDLLPKVDPTGV
jgi:hypothetical protein